MGGRILNDLLSEEAFINSSTMGALKIAQRRAGFFYFLVRLSVDLITVTTVKHPLPYHGPGLLRVTSEIVFRQTYRFNKPF